MTKILPADQFGIERAAQLLEAGQIVAVPTETVYGLAADATNEAAVTRIFAAKGRPNFNPLIVHVDGAAMAARYSEADELARELMLAFWPGPLTLVLPLRPDSRLAASVTAGLSTVALRAPSHRVPRAIIAALGQPLAAPSANPSGRVSATTAAHVAEAFGEEVPLVLDAGRCEVGLESTIVAVCGGRLRLLRPGPVSVEQLRAFAELDESGCETPGKVEAPGMLASHYAPRKPLRLDAAAAEADEFLIGFGEVVGDLSLSRGGELQEAAANLFAHLHAADMSAKKRIAVAPIPREGLGAAMNDRLRRAAK